MGYALFQKGPIPAMLDLDLIVRSMEDKYHKQLIDGLKRTGLYQLALEVQSVNKLLSYIREPLRVNHLLNKFDKVYSERDNHSRVQRQIYDQVLKYCRQAFQGQRVNGKVTLEQILRFVTGMTWEPMFGYSITPAIHFAEKEDKEAMYPTSSTCANILYLLYSLRFTMVDDQLFEKFDMAFINDYFSLQ